MRKNRGSLPSVIAAVIGLAGVEIPGLVEAKDQYRANPSEIPLLPAYCQARLNSEEWQKSSKRWEKVLGPDTLHIHHYCYSLVYINRAKLETTDRRARKYNLDVARGEIGYVLARTTDGAPLAPEFHITKGEILLLSEHRAEAETSYRKAAGIRPSYPKSWLALSDLYLQTGRQQQAREALEQGLKAAPEKYKDHFRKRLAELPSAPPATSPAANAPTADQK